MIYPEGTRSRTGIPGEFKPGIGLLAKKTGVPVVPVRVTGSNEILPPGSTVPRPETAHVAFGAPLKLEDGEDTREFPRRLREAVLSLRTEPRPRPDRFRILARHVPFVASGFRSSTRDRSFCFAATAKHLHPLDRRIGYGLDAGECNRPPRRRRQRNHAAQLNEARELLANPEQRANLRLNMLVAQCRQDQRLPDGFLMEMLELRERIDAEIEAEGAPATERWQVWVDTECTKSYTTITPVLDAESASEEERIEVRLV